MLAVHLSGNPTQHCDSVKNSKIIDAIMNKNSTISVIKCPGTKIPVQTCKSHSDSLSGRAINAVNWKQKVHQ